MFSKSELVTDVLAAASRAVTFTVRRPQVELVYPSPGAHVLLLPSHGGWAPPPSLLCNPSP